MREDVFDLPVASQSLTRCAGVGKTSLLHRYTQGKFDPKNTTSTTGAFFVTKKVTVDGTKVRLQLWDTAGQERFRTITSSYYRGAQGIILVYDVANRESFDGLPKWYSELETYVSPAVVKIIVGNKVDKVC